MTHRNQTAVHSGPWCAVCKDAGKPASEYMSHFVKDKPGPDGVVVCPYLLSTVCRYCGHSGHTPSHCPEIRRRDARRRRPAARSVSSPRSPPKSTNAFDILRGSDTDTQSDTESNFEDVDLTEDAAPDPVPNMSQGRSWAAVAMAPPKPVQPRDPWAGFNDTPADTVRPKTAQTCVHGSALDTLLREDVLMDWPESDDDMEW